VEFTRRELQLFLWYELPRKRLVDADEHVAVVFDELTRLQSGRAGGALPCAGDEASAA
jgi:hypothetical protein